jgi:hypothetical protein
MQPLERIGRSINKEKEAPDDLLVISCEEDYETCVALLEKGYNHLDIISHSDSYCCHESGLRANVNSEPTGANVYEAELVLNGIVIQKLEYDRFVMKP